MAATKRAMIEALDYLLDEELNDFIWELWNPMTEDIEPIPRARLEKAKRRDVVDRISEQYCDNAGDIAVKALLKIKKNDLANKLQKKLQEVQQPEQVDGGNAPVSVEETLVIQSDWRRPLGVTPCTQEFKNWILRENRNDIYIPKDKYHRKRFALLINNREFAYEENNRYGAEKDEKNMEWLLTALGYSVEKHTNLSATEINAAVKNFTAPYKHQDSDSTFVVLMSHGDRIRNKDVILGVNYHHLLKPNDFFFIDDIFYHLNSVNCPALIDKPKVILIQACRGSHSGGVAIQSDAAHRGVHIEKDFISFRSCTPGTVAYRDTLNGSYFIMYIVEVFCRWAHCDEIRELFRKVTSYMVKDPRFKNVGVDGELAKLLSCVERETLHNKLYLFPGL